MIAAIHTYAGLPSGISAFDVKDVNGIDQHVLTAGETTASRGVLLLLHGFPELSFSWRHVMVPLAEAGFYVVAPDQRGYGLTTGWDGEGAGDVESFSAAALVQDVVRLLDRMQVGAVATVVGHDFGSLVAARAALLRPDIFKSVVLMSAPMTPVPPIGAVAQLFESLASGLRGLDPPREHYQCYFSGNSAEDDILNSEQGLVAFLRGYIHGKSGDWHGNKPHALGGMTPEDLAELPTYYVMPAGVGMAKTIAPYYEDYLEQGACRWLTDEELAVYAATFAASGFQGGLNWYRCLTQGIGEDALSGFVGAPIAVPAGFVAGDRDWGVHQTPGAFDAMQTRGCADFRGAYFVEGAGHWVQQERPQAVVDALLQFAEGLA